MDFRRTVARDRIIDDLWGDDLPESAQKMEAASVAGQRFSAASVAAALDRDTAEVEARCGALARSGRFLESHGEDSWPDGTIASCFAFSHDLQREVVYDRLPAARRGHVPGGAGPNRRRQQIRGSGGSSE